MIKLIETTFSPKSRGFHLVTGKTMRQLPKLPQTGILNLFCKHTSCGLMEGHDGMPAHAKSTLSGVSLTIPITDVRLNLGTWQGIYLCEYRNYGGTRKLVATII